LGDKATVPAGLEWNAAAHAEYAVHFDDDREAADGESQTSSYSFANLDEVLGEIPGCSATVMENQPEYPVHGAINAVDADEVAGRSAPICFLDCRARDPDRQRTYKPGPAGMEPTSRHARSADCLVG
jgi:hypothetical protein